MFGNTKFGLSLFNWICSLALCGSLSAAYLGVGLRKDSISWSVGVEEVDVLSELKYQNLNIIEGVAGIKLPLFFLQVELDAAGGLIYEGKDRDSDYLWSGRAGEWSRSRSDVDGYVVDVTLGVGRSLCWVTPKVGVAWHRQFLVARNGCDEILPFADEEGEILGGFAANEPFYWTGINSTYVADWVTGWVGAELCGCWAKWRGQATLQIHGGAYFGKPTWYLRPDVAKRSHTAGAYIVALQLRLDRKVLGPLALFVGFDGYYGWTDRGSDHVRSANGERLVQRFDNGEWWSIAGIFGLSLCF